MHAAQRVLGFTAWPLIIVPLRGKPLEMILF
jgi:hypothetical protein